MGSLTTTANYSPKNLLHILLDNNSQIPLKKLLTLSLILILYPLLHLAVIQQESLDELKYLKNAGIIKA